MGEMSEYENAVVEALRIQAKSARAQEEHLAKIRKYVAFFYGIWWLMFFLGVLAVVLAIVASADS